jgi:hypothetical protein
MPDSNDTIDNLLPGRFEDTDFAALAILRRARSLSQRTESNARQQKQLNQEENANSTLIRDEKHPQ